MDSTMIAQAVYALQQAGAAVVINLPSAYGDGSQFSLTPSAAAAFVEGPKSFIATQLGVSLDQLEAWREYERSPRCAAHTARGNLCANEISPHSVTGPYEFAALHRLAYCRAHKLRLAEPS
jgi:hypothetical protein